MKIDPDSLRFEFPWSDADAGKVKADDHDFWKGKNVDLDDDARRYIEYILGRRVSNGEIVFGGTLMLEGRNKILPNTKVIRVGPRF